MPPPGSWISAASATSCAASRAASATEPLSHVTPLAVPVLLEIGQELVYGGGVAEAILREAADDLVREAMQRG